MNDALLEIVEDGNGSKLAKGNPTLRLRGSVRGATVEQVISLVPGEKHFHVNVSASIPGDPPKLDYLMSSYTFVLPRIPEFVHTPTLKYTEHRWPGDARDQVIGDRAYHSPAVILQEGRLFAALVPDLRAINERQVVSPDARRVMAVPRNQFSVPVEADKYTMPTALDLNVASGLTPKPILSFGMMDYIASHHMRYLRSNDGKMIRTLATNEVGYSFNLFVSADAKPGRGYQDASRFLWTEYGHEVFTNRPHLAMPFAEYVSVTTDANLKPLGGVHPPVEGFKDTGSFLYFDLAGQPVGGYRSPIPGHFDLLSNSEFWNNVRDAIGTYEWGKNHTNAAWLDLARRTVNLALLAPQDSKGMFPLNYRAASKKWVRSMFTAAPGRAVGLFSTLTEEGDTYNIVAMSRTATHLLRYHDRCEADPRIIPFLTRYADGLLPLVREDGSLPAYVSAKDHSPYNAMMRSAQDATSLQFLAAMSRVTNTPNAQAYQKAARRIGDRLIREVLPRQLWTDLEQYYSCGAKPFTFQQDAEQGQPVRGNLATLWAADGFAELYQATGDRRYLDAGEQCVDYLAFTQCGWNPHYIYTAFPFGGLTVDNADTATYLDARQCEAVAPFAWYGRKLGRQDLLERAVAAARSSTVLINHPRHQGANDIYRHVNLYSLGLGPENIDHEGHPQSAMRTNPSWGEASGVFTGLAEAVWQLGGAYVDVTNNVHVGVDGLQIDDVKLEGDHLKIRVRSMLATLPQPWETDYQTQLHLTGLAWGDYRVTLNNQPETVIKVQNPLEIYELQVSSGGYFRLEARTGGHK